jgi:hypothetical protein
MKRSDSIISETGESIPEEFPAPFSLSPLPSTVSHKVTLGGGNCTALSSGNPCTAGLQWSFIRVPYRQPPNLFQPTAVLFISMDAGRGEVLETGPAVGPEWVAGLLPARGSVLYARWGRDLAVQPLARTSARYRSRSFGRLNITTAEQSM